MSVPLTRPVVRPEGQGEWLNGVAGVRYLVRLGGDETSGELAVVECVLEPGALGAAPHVHHAHAEHFHVVSGEVLFDVDGAVVEAGPDTWVSVPRGCAHGFRNASPDDALVRCLVTPAGYENYFRSIDAAIEAGVSLEAAALASMRAEYSTDTL